MLKPEPPWDFDVPGAICSLKLPRVYLEHRIVKKNGFWTILVKENDGEVWCLARKKSLEEAQESILNHCRQFALWNGRWYWGPRELRVHYRKPLWL